MDKGVLLWFHTPSNVGYAIAPQEQLFFEIAKEIAGSESRVFVAYSSLSGGIPKSLPENFPNVIEFDLKNPTEEGIAKAKQVVEKNNIKILLGYDAPVKSKFYSHLRKSGLERIVAHWGAPLSSLNQGLKLKLKQLEMALYRQGPDLFILQSKGMQDTAIIGRGIQKNRTTVIPTGVNTELHKPHPKNASFLQENFGIPPGSFVVFCLAAFKDFFITLFLSFSIAKK